MEPAVQLARDGVDFLPAHAACLAMLAPVMTMNEGADIYAPGGELLKPATGSSNRVWSRRSRPSPMMLQRSTAARSPPLLALSAERGGLLNRADFDAYEASWTDPVEVGYADGRLLTRGSGCAVRSRGSSDLEGSVQLASYDWKSTRSATATFRRESDNSVAILRCKP